MGRTNNGNQSSAHKNKSATILDDKPPLERGKNAKSKSTVKTNEPSHYKDTKPSIVTPHKSHTQQLTKFYPHQQCVNIQIII